MSKIQTACKGCVFVEKQGGQKGQQTGCTLGRHDKLGIEQTDDNGHFVLERFCNTYRPDQWTQDLSLEEALAPEKTVLEEVFPRIGFFVRLETSEDSGEGLAIKSLIKTIESINNIEGATPAYVAVITDKVEYNEEVWGTLAPLYEDTDTKYHIVQMEYTAEDQSLIIDEAFGRAQNGWVYITTAGESVPSDVLTKIHKLVNVEMRQLVLVEPYDNFNGMIFPAFLFKFLNGNRAKLFQDETTAEGAFVTKLREAEERTENPTGGILTWEEFNAT